MHHNKAMLTSFHLKCIALVSMMIDHFAVIWRPYLSLSSYQILRGIGRISFPLFAFILVEGFVHTKNREKHLALLLVFALICELPFDICLKHSLSDSLPGPFDWVHQSIFLTLSIGFMSMMLLSRSYSDQEQMIILITSCIIAEVLGVDYGCLGVITILLFYYRRIHADLQAYKLGMFLPLIPLALSSYKTHVQITCVLAVIPLSLYNGKKGPGIKYFFYIMYPLHMIVFFLIKYYCM